MTSERLSSFASERNFPQADDAVSLTEADTWEPALHERRLIRP